MFVSRKKYEAALASLAVQREISNSRERKIEGLTTISNLRAAKIKDLEERIRIIRNQRDSVLYELDAVFALATAIKNPVNLGEVDEAGGTILSEED